MVRFHSGLVVLEWVAILLFALVLIMPIQDYALREYETYIAHPSPQTLDAFHQKQRTEWQARLMIAVPFGAAAVLLARLAFLGRKAIQPAKRARMCEP